MRLSKWLLVGTIVALLGGGQPQSVRAEGDVTRPASLNPSQDTFASLRQTSQVNGDEASLKVAYSPAGSTNPQEITYGFLQFDLSAIPEAATILTVNLELPALELDYNQNVELKLAGAPKPWNEDDNANGLGADEDLPDQSTVLTVRTLTPDNRVSLVRDGIQLDGTDKFLELVQAWHADADNNVGLVVYASDRTNPYALLLGSRENDNPDKRPVLNLTYSEPDNQAPVIANVTIDEQNPGEVTVRWSTEEPGDSYVSYGRTKEYGTSFGQDAMTTAHAVTITGLAPETTYHFQPRSTDENGNTGLGEDQSYDTQSLNSEEDPANEEADPEQGDSPETTDETEADPDAEVAATTAEAAEGEDPDEPTATTSSEVPTNEKKERLANTAAAGIDLTESADAYVSSPTVLDRIKDHLAAILPAVALILILGFLFRHSIANYLGAPDEPSDTPPAPPQPPPQQPPFTPTPGQPTRASAPPPVMPAARPTSPAGGPTPVPVAPPPQPRPNPTPQRPPGVLDLSGGKRN